jgi:ubiquinone biosynthesis accessory factor UbiJ
MLQGVARLQFRMFRSLQTLVESAVMPRVTLLINHVLSAEPIALDRLRPHSGASIEVTFNGWPSLLPPLPAFVFRVTPAGLIEWLGDRGLGDRGLGDSGLGDNGRGQSRPGDSGLPEADLRVAIDASNPALAFAQAVVGAKPHVSVDGSAAFAADVDWLIANVRWDIEDELARIVGAAPAHQIGRLARASARGLRDALHRIRGLVTHGAAAPQAPVGPAPR